MPEVRQRYLFIPAGRENADFVVLAAEGSLVAMKDQEDTIQAIFASYGGTGK